MVSKGGCGGGIRKNFQRVKPASSLLRAELSPKEGKNPNGTGRVQGLLGGQEKSEPEIYSL